LYREGIRSADAKLFFFLGAITTKRALLGLMQKNDCCEINAKKERSQWPNFALLI